MLLHGIGCSLTSATALPSMTISSPTPTTSSITPTPTPFLPPTVTFRTKSCTINPSSMCCSTQGTWFRCTSGTRQHTRHEERQWCPWHWCPWNGGCYYCLAPGDPHETTGLPGGTQAVTQLAIMEEKMAGGGVPGYDNKGCPIAFCH